MDTNMFGAKAISNTSADLIRDFKRVTADAEALLKATANQGGETLAALRTKTEDSLAIAKAKMAEVEEKVRATASASDDYVHEHPWRVVGAAVGVGVVIGLLIGRR